MIATVVGKRRSDFMGNDGAVKNTKWYITYAADGVEGHEVGFVSWDELKNGTPPAVELGGTLEVEYNKYGKLKLVTGKK